ncbi:MAG: hypothetical protein ABMB14_23575 [Myxococcota bacterium]
MTLPNWGRLTPTQALMLSLAGHVLHGHPVEPGTVETDEDRLASMREGRDGLIAQTGRDLGFDLSRWHELLLASVDDAWGYRHPYGWRRVRSAIERALADPDRARLARMLEEELGPRR